MIRSDIKKKHAILIAVILLTAVLVVATTHASASYAILVDKTVYDPDSGERVKALTAELNDTLRFNCTITNLMSDSLSDILFWDVLDCSLEYAGNATLNGTSIELDPYTDDEFIFKPKVLEPDNLSWNPYDPFEDFHELCPDIINLYNLYDENYWYDHDNDKRLSECDQIDLGYCSEEWYHVEHVPYTLVLENMDTGEGCIYMESELDYEVFDLSNPNDTQWTKACSCNDGYQLENWSDVNETGDLNEDDTIMLRNKRTGEVANYSVWEVTIDLVVNREHAVDDILYGYDEFILEPGQTISIEYDVTVVDCGVDNNTFHAKGWYCPDACEWVYSNEAKVTITVPCPALEVNKTVWNGTAWVKALTAQLNDTLQFNCTITNTGNVDLEQIRFWDILDCSLMYQEYSLKINGSSVCIYDSPWFRFKPHVLHPDDSVWISNPIWKNFTELYPPWHYRRQLVNWTDTNHDGNVSACDQVQLENRGSVVVENSEVPLQGGYGSFDNGNWYHVDRVPYTLNLYNESWCRSTKYFDSVDEWNAVDLSNPINSTWFYLCGCKDKYTLLNWINQGCPYLDSGDFVTLQNERTQEVVTGEVDTDVVIDLVVSREYEIDDYLCDLTQLAPGQTITIEYNATVVKCGVDNNTFVAKGQWCEENWIYSDPAVVTITVPCPYGDAADKTPEKRDLFTAGEDVYALAHNFAPNKNVSIYITNVRTWAYGDKISDYAKIGPINTTTDANGSIGLDPNQVLVWPNSEPGLYHMVFDDPDGIYEPGVDIYDFFEVRGRAAVPLVTLPGLVALIGLLSIIATSTLVRKRRR